MVNMEFDIESPESTWLCEGKVKLTHCHSEFKEASKINGIYI